MKFFFFFILISSLALAREGGHEGNGGHVCWDRALNRSYSLEEIRYRFLRNENQRPSVDLAGRASFERIQMDLSHPLLQTIATKFQLLTHDQPLLSAMLIDSMGLYQEVYVRRRKILRGQRGAGSTGVLSCPEPMEIRPAVLTFFNGGIVFLEDTWQLSSSTTQQILLIHETLRFLQMLHPAMGDLGNDALEHLTAEIFQKKTSGQNSKASSIEKKLTVFKLPQYNGPTYEEAMRQKDLVTALRSRVHASVLEESSFADAIRGVLGDAAFSVLQQRELRNQLR